MIDARACSTLTPGFSRANRYAQYEPAVLEAGLPNIDSIESRIVIGTNTCGSDAERGALEPPRRDADDGHGLAVDDERLVQDVAALVEPGPPVVVAEHHDVRLADRPVVALVQQPAERGLEAEDREVAARHQHARAPFSVCPR